MHAPPHRSRLLLCLLSVLLALFVHAGAAGVHAQPVAGADQTATTVLPNGLTVVTHTHPAATTASIAVTVRAGARDETPELRGGAHFLEHLLFLGSEHYPTEAALDTAVGDVGGLLNGVTNSETTTYYITVPASAFTTGMDVLADMLLRPLFDPDQVKQEKEVVLIEIGSRCKTCDEEASAEDTFLEDLAGPAVRDPGGTTDAIEAMTLDDLRAFMALRYVARNMAVAVVGPFPADYVSAYTWYDFNTLTPGKAQVTQLPAEKDGLRVVSEDYYGVLVAQRIPGLNSADAAALKVMDAILDVPGTRMSDALEAGENTYGGGTNIVQFSDVGLWMTFSGGDADEVLSIVQAQLQLLQTEPVPQAELDKATHLLAGQLLTANDQSWRQVVRLAQLSLFGAYQPEEQQAARILGVTADDIMRVARKYFNTDNLSMLSAKPRPRGPLSTP